MAAPRTQTIRQRRLGTELRKLREDSGLTGETVAARFSWSTAKVSRLETAKTSATVADVDLLLQLYEVGGGRRRELLALAHDARERGWWMDLPGVDPEYSEFIAMEDEADAQLLWETAVIPGLLQTENYAKAIIGFWNALTSKPPAELQRLVDIRMRRQHVLIRPVPQRLTCVLDESVLLRRHATPAIMREQLLHLVKLSQEPTIDLRVLRLNGPQPLVAEPFMLLEFRDVHDVTFPDIVHTEGLTANHRENERDVHKYRRAFEQLSAAALSVEGSRLLIERIARETWGIDTVRSH
ncbi:helix-turn-helix transcriptional regulator [Actinocorallia lasiicapitis]